MLSLPAFFRPLTRPQRRLGRVRGRTNAAPTLRQLYPAGIPESRSPFLAASWGGWDGPNNLLSVSAMTGQSLYTAFARRLSRRRSWEARMGAHLSDPRRSVGT